MSLLTLFGPAAVVVPVAPAAGVPVFTFTGTLGSPQAQPGAMVPGFYGTGIAVWKGPFACEAPPADLDGKRGALRVGDQITVPLAVASQLANSDRSWWEFH